MVNSSSGRTRNNIGSSISITIEGDLASMNGGTFGLIKPYTLEFKSESVGAVQSDEVVSLHHHHAA